MKKIVIVDDEISIVIQLKMLLKDYNYDVFATDDSLEALDYIRNNPVDLLLSDIRMPEMNGIQLTEEVLKIDPGIVTILLTAYADVESTIEAMNKGAFKYIVKPYKNEEVIEAIKQALERSSYIRRQSVATTDDIISIDPDTIVGKSSTFLSIIQQLPAIAASDATVLIMGESGVGKELIARRIHNLSNRCDHPFVAVNCGALPENLLESELFGFVKGAFTGAISKKAGLMATAEKGTFFMDEISELSLSLQVKLLRAIQRKEILPLGQTFPQLIDIRLIVATNKYLYEEVKRGRFREDLYYRLNVIPLVIPPLKERKDDIEELVKLFLKRLNMEDMFEMITKEAWDKLLGYKWPGNVRELENIIERLVVVKHGQKIYASDIPIDSESEKDEITKDIEYKKDLLIVSQSSDNSEILEEFNGTLAELESIYIRNVLERVGGNRNKAAKILGINPATLFRKLRE
ncbi:MAG: sigma-54-dependent Fis family transcriptional regulator [Candidatus Coatesbacteria bacterium]|nr:sigma-54-dependent Fis family transcriptional regulator [Candidatus Coatesbacteria bacterium]